MTDKLKKIINLIKDKRVMLVCHYDADGVASGALLYHLLKGHAKSIKTLSKGLVFKVEPEDIDNNSDITVICDIKASERLDKSRVIYIDHHPDFNGDISEKDFLFRILDTEIQSCSLLIWRDLIPQTNNPYYIFLTLIGYFGDGGDRNNIPVELEVKASELLSTKTKFGTHNLMSRKSSYYGDGEYLEVEKYVSALNTGKRMHWNGNVPLELLKSITCFRPFIYNLHPIAEQLNQYKEELKNLYSMKIKLTDLKQIQYAIIQCERNIQGVLCARYMKNKPILIMNKYNGTIIASMRVPDELEFDAGAYLSGISDMINTVVGGGHEKAGGITFPDKDLDKVIDIMKQI